MVDSYSGQEGKRKNQLLPGVELRYSDWESSALCTEPQLPDKRSHKPFIVIFLSNPPGHGSSTDVEVFPVDP